MSILMPKEKKFHQLFQKQAEIMLNEVNELKAMLDKFNDPEQSLDKIKKLEHQGDEVTREITETLNHAFITPFGREYICSLTHGLDDILDIICAAAQRIVVYKVLQTTPTARKIGELSLNACQKVAQLMQVFDGKKIEHKKVHDYCVKVWQLEKDVDKVCREAISDLFDKEANPVELIKWKEIYEKLEVITDNCKFVCKLITTMVIDHA
jgi:predicted phosphate transport protein (TIGR00153 family)